MSEASELRNRIHALEREMSAAEERQRRQRDEITRRNEEETGRLRREIEQSERRTEEFYARRAMELREELAERNLSFQRELRRADEESQALRRQYLERLEDESRELKNEIRKILEHEHEITRANRDMAELCFRQADAKAAEVEQMPHDFFYPGQLAVFREHLESVSGMARSGAWEAAAAVADAALAELEILEINIREQQKEWEEMYNAYRDIADRVRRKLDAFEREEIRTAYGRFHMEDGERAYWSQGGYSTVRRDADEAYRLVDGIEREKERAGGVGSYLRDFPAVKKGFQFRRAIRELNRLEERADAAIFCVRNERIYSDERFCLGEAAEAALSREGFRITRRGFREKRPSGADADEIGIENKNEPDADRTDEEPLDCYDVEATPNGIDILRVTFAPVRRDGVTARNICLISADVRTIPNPGLIERLGRDVIACIRPRLSPQPEIVWCGEGSRMDSAELEYKKYPDMDAKARTLARKY